MNRRQLAFLIVINAFISLAIALCVAWVIEARRPDPEELAALAQPAVLSAETTPQNSVPSTTVENSAPAAVGSTKRGAGSTGYTS